MRNPAYVRNFESVLRALCERGQPITVLFSERKPGGDRAGLAIVDRLAREHANLRMEMPKALPAADRERPGPAHLLRHRQLRTRAPPPDRRGPRAGAPSAPT